MNLEINTQQLNVDIQTLTGKLEELIAVRGQIFSCLGALNSMWAGGAHDAFVAQVQVDGEFLQQMLLELKNLIECLQYAKKEYEICAQDVHDQIAAVHLSGDD